VLVLVLLLQLSVDFGEVVDLFQEGVEIAMVASIVVPEVVKFVLEFNDATVIHVVTASFFQLDFEHLYFFE
jgi:hypothetical protein